MSPAATTSGPSPFDAAVVADLAVAARVVVALDRSAPVVGGAQPLRTMATRRTPARHLFGGVGKCLGERWMHKQRLDYVGDLQVRRNGEGKH